MKRDQGDSPRAAAIARAKGRMAAAGRVTQAAKREAAGEPTRIDNPDRFRSFWERKPLAPPGGHGVAIADRVRRRELRAR
jgi:hypothetical protein